MKKLFTIIILLSLIISIQAFDLKERIQRYGGSNSAELLDLLANSHSDTLQYVEFLLQNCSSSDLALLNAEYLMKNIRYALKTKDFEFTKDYDDNIFYHFVLPHRMSQEPLENWRESYYNQLKDIVKDFSNIEEAAIAVNIWCLQQMTYKPTHGRDQSAFTSAKRGFGRCEEMMIIYMCAARSVGIPVRSCSAPYWNFTDSNHAWIEVWTPSGWKYLGEPASQLSKTWFTNTTQRATLITAKAFGNYDHSNSIKQEDNVTTLSSIEYYTDSYNCKIKVADDTGQPVPNANVYPYAVSFGGIWPMVEMKTDDSGCCNIPLGASSTLFIAGKDSLFAWEMFSNLDKKDHEISLVLKDRQFIDDDFQFKFPLPGSNPMDNEEPAFFEETFSLMRENADLKRKNRLFEQQHTLEFTDFFDQICENTSDDDYFDKRKDFIEKSTQLAANADDFLHVINKTDENGKWVIQKMITTWDIKDLCEIPDSTALESLVDIYRKNRFRFAATDSLFTEGCIARTWSSASPVQNGWQAEFYKIFESQISTGIDATVADIIWQIENITEIDDDFIWTYYSGSLNPLEIINMHYIPEFYRTKIINSALKLAGIPVRWQGQLQFHNGSEWLAVNSAKDMEKESVLHEFKLDIFIDDIQVKAEPYDNFLIANLNNDGYLYNTWFEGENDSLTFNGKYRLEDDSVLHIEAVVRNDNGDAHVFIKPLNLDSDYYEIKLYTPKEYIDVSNSWDNDTIDKVIDITKNSEHQGYKIITILAENSSEPQVHTIEFLADKIDEYQKKNAKLYIYAEKRSVKNLKSDSRLNDAVIMNGKKILKNLDPQNYPAVFLLDSNNNLIFSSTGYNMGIADLIKKKM